MLELNVIMGSNPIEAGLLLVSMGFYQLYSDFTGPGNNQLRFQFGKL